MKLFDDVIDSPVRTANTDWDENELAEIITPYSKSVKTGDKTTAEFSVSTTFIYQNNFNSLNILQYSTQQN